MGIRMRQQHRPPKNPTMRNALLLTFALAAFATPPLQAQNLGRMIADRVPLASNKSSVTTSIKDALPLATHLVDVDELTPLPLPEDFNFGPGYYRGEIRSYCLHAGTYGPTTGDGYLVAPLKGTHAGIIRGILVRSARHQEINQRDVQRLIWGIEDGASWDSFDSSFKARVAPVLSAQDIAVLNAEPMRKEVAGKLKARIGKLIPGGAQNVVSEVNSWRGRLTSAGASFEELERAAILSGDAPWGAGSRKEVRPGNWAYIGDGFYLRTFSKSYSTTTLEVFRTGTADITRDALNRITRFDSDGYVIDTRYQPGDTPQTVDGRLAWRLSEVTFRHPDGRSLTLRDKGHVFLPGMATAPAMAMAMLAYGGHDPFTAHGDLGDMKHYEDGLKSATDPSDFKGRGQWLQEHFGRVKAAWQAAADALAGDTGDAPPGPGKRPLNPSGHVAAPANTSKQRLGMSPALQRYGN